MSNPFLVNQGYSLGYCHVQHKVLVPQILCIVTFDCNLRCRYCFHFCDKLEGRISVQSIKEGIAGWGKKIVPHRLVIMGGEPFLNHDLEEILLHCRKTWSNTNIQITTNGTLLEEQKESLWNVINGVTSRPHRRENANCRRLGYHSFALNPSGGARISTA